MDLESRIAKRDANRSLVGQVVARLVDAEHYLSWMGSRIEDWFSIKIANYFLLPYAVPINNRLLGAIGKGISHPYLFTKLLGASEALKYIQPGTQPGEGDPAVIAPHLLMCLLLDKVISNSQKRRESRLRESDDPLDKVMDESHYEGALQDIVGANGKKKVTGKVVSLAPLDGTLAFKKGYFAKLTILLEDGTQIPVLYKYSQRGLLENPTAVTENLREIGIDWVPKSFSSRGLGGNEHSTINQGTLIEWKPGQSVEQSTGVGREKVVSDAVSIEDIAEICSLVEEMYLEQPRPMYSAFNNRVACEPKRLQFHQKLVAGIGEGFFSRYLDNTVQELFSDVPLRLIHGDLHQGNIVIHESALNGSDPKSGSYPNDNLENKFFVIDWDNVQLGLPYLDFMYLTVLTDTDRHPRFQELKSGFLKDQTCILDRAFTMPFERRKKIDQGHLDLTEFEVYLSLLNRYDGAIQQGLIEPEFVEGMKRSCKYLLHQSIVSAEAVSRSVDDPMFAHEYRRFVSQRFKGLEDVTLDDRASVAYAHRVNHEHRIAQKGEYSVSNHQAHQSTVEDCLRAATVWRSVGEATWMGLTAFQFTDVFRHGIEGKYPLEISFCELAAAGFIAMFSGLLIAPRIMKTKIPSPLLLLGYYGTSKSSAGDAQ